VPSRRDAHRVVVRWRADAEIDGALDARIRHTMTRALLDWLESLTSARVRDVADLYDGRILTRAVRQVCNVARRSDDDNEEAADDDLNLNRLRELLLEQNMPGAHGMVDALVARDEKGTQRLLREVYAEHLSRRVASFTLERSFEEASETSRGAAGKDDDDVGRDDDEDDGNDEHAIEDDVIDDFCDVDYGDWEEDIEDETDLTSDWVALATPEKQPSTSKPTSPCFVKASDVLAHAFDACAMSLPGVVATVREQPPKTPSARKFPSPVPKKLTLHKTPPKEERRAPPLTWDIVFDEPKSNASTFPRWVPGASSSSGDAESPPSAPPPRERDDVVAWLGDKTNCDALRVAAERRGRPSSVSPKSSTSRAYLGERERRRRSEGGCVPSYVPTPRPSNKRLIRNALRSVCLAGPINHEAYVAAVAAVDACDEPSVVILFKGAANVAPKKMRGVYAVEDEMSMRLIHGVGPQRLRASDVATTMKYDTATQDFIIMTSTAITPIVAAISITPGH